ncbi:GAF domain-containing sensor histidine kinase [Natrarchaeobius chitinivorans]|uniref:histidine kinase n=1 Tax=Natrarchaeobius chitinivorans TaxID=1679083 RepID=A0A3N6ML89_NATCH|nr:GAF domain-containing sensor histidine kinase [Natrarchaeobius chitinivorans]RQG98040.1 GAF domain-containing protein [Natrarchaeobius chitinivorans]
MSREPQHPKSAESDRDFDESGTSRRSFRVLSVGASESSRDRIADELEPTYCVGTANSPAGVRDAIDDGVDCLVTASDLDAERTVELLEYVRNRRPELPVLCVDSSFEPVVLRSLLDVEIAEIVAVTDADSLTETDVERLRARIDEYYHRSISDIRETVLDISRSLMGAAPDETDIEIEWGLQLVGRQLDADRCLVFEYDGDRLEPTHNWTREAARTDRIESVPPSSFPGFETISKSFGPCAVPATTDDDLNLDIPDDFVGDLVPSPGRHERDGEAVSTSHPYLRDRNLESFLAVPIVVDWELVGILAIEQEIRRPWPRSLRQQIQTFAELVGYTLDREQRRRELARQNDRLERFVSVVSHDLRNPINVLSGYADLIAETGNVEHIEDVSVAADRMETMIDDLLTLARQGNELEGRESVDLEETASHAWNAVDTANATLEIRDPGTVQGDPGRLQQAFENLFRNAVEHGGRRVTVSVVGTDDGFAVEDDGPGIPPEQRKRIFREGYTGGDGTGLGLSIVETVVDAHDWSISVETGDDGGARFAFVTACPGRDGADGPVASHRGTER